MTVNSGANITGIATLAQAYIAKLAQSNGTSGSVNEVPVANGSGGWSWAPVNTAGASVLQGITVQEEGIKRWYSRKYRNIKLCWW